MKKLTLKIFVLLACLGAASLASADDDDVPADLPPPVNQPVTTTVNQKQFNVRLDPLALILGEVNADFDIRVSQNVTVGPELLLINRTYEGSQFSGGGIGARANISLGHMAYTDGWILGPFVDLLGLQIAQSGYNTLKLGGVALGTAIAYQWVWNSGFNLDLGADVGVFTFPNSVTLTSNTGTSSTVETAYSSGFVGLELSLGYAF